MSDRVFVATRKGLFRLDRDGDGGASPWRITRASFLGDNLSIVLPDARDGCVYAAADHGHFGVKLHRSRDGGETWEACAVPVYPEPPAGEPDRCPMSG
ncbi:MAG: exo-alpha-sialidase, partial [Phycisphaerae bacterium]